MVSVNTNANSLQVGTYADTVAFTNLTTSAGSTTQRLIAYLSFAMLVLLVLTRLLLRRRLPLGPTERLFLGLFLANALVMAVFFTRTRFRQPLDNILLIEAAIAAAVMISLISARRRKPRPDADRSSLEVPPNAGHT